MTTNKTVRERERKKERLKENLQRKIMLKNKLLVMGFMLMMKPNITL